jgi:hypothetical protein
LLQFLRQKVYQVAAGYEDCNDADHLRVDPALRLGLWKEFDSGAWQSALCRFENNILATGGGAEGSGRVTRSVHRYFASTQEHAATRHRCLFRGRPRMFNDNYLSRTRKARALRFQRLL